MKFIDKDSAMKRLGNKKHSILLKLKYYIKIRTRAGEINNE